MSSSNERRETVGKVLVNDACETVLWRREVIGGRWKVKVMAGTRGKSAEVYSITKGD